MAKQQKLKVGLVLDDGLDKPDGVQQYILSLGAWLKKRGHHVHYIVGQTTRTDIDNIHAASKNVRVRSNGNSMTIPLPTSHVSLLAILANQKFDVLHIQTPFSPFMGGRLLKLASSKTAVVGTFHILPNSTRAYVGTRILGAYSFRTLKRIDAMLSVSEVAATFAKKTYKINSTVIPNVFDFTRFSKAKPLERYKDKTLTIMFLGRLVPRKGCATLLHAVHILSLRSDIPAFRLVICGSGSQMKQLKKDVVKYNLEEIVVFEGFVEESIKPQMLASADLTVFPSSGGESFGIVLLEALASGKSVVLAGNNPGYASIMSEKPELLFEAKSPTKLASKMAQYLKVKKQRNLLRAWGKKHAKQFDVSVIGPKIEAVYYEALQKRRGK